MLSKKVGSYNQSENVNGGEKMEQTGQDLVIISRAEKEEIEWAEYLDYTRFFESAEINNIALELYKKDCEKIG